MLNCSIGIMAYNEEANIGNLLEALLIQKTHICPIKEIYVVASGCEDGTEDIVRDYSKKDGRIKLLVQENREGKASAVNLFLSVAQGEIIMLESADTIPAPGTIEKMAAPFFDPSVGMTGGRPVPVDSPDNFLGFTVNLLWRLHHMISLEHPKMGELIAFRNVVKEIPVDTAVDEASIEAIVTDAGFRIKYAEDAVVYNKGPENIREFIKQRRRIAAGHIYVGKTQHHSVSTTSVTHILKPLLRDLKWSMKDILWTSGAVLLEAWGRFLGFYDFHVRKRNPFIWDISTSTKKLKGTIN
ncbi:MAG: glycosyltransferase [Nitrospiraceae bacterium]|nr:MAG: glycosyltransferase [Nitrospiraceae bacterium]